MAMITRFCSTAPVAEPHSSVSRARRSCQFPAQRQCLTNHQEVHSSLPPTECFMKSKPRIFFSLLALCYLEIVLWTACLAANGGAIEGHKYLQRETGNLKAFTGVSHPTPLLDELALAICEHHTALEHLCLQQQFNAFSVISSSLLQQPPAQSLRAFPTVQGLPAPFTGVQAID